MLTRESSAAAILADNEKCECFHCGTPCRSGAVLRLDHAFCCQGCATVFDLLHENGLENYYQINRTAGVRVAGSVEAGRFDYLDEPVVRDRLVDFANDRVTKVTFRIPAIHCVACVWLLENLFRLKEGLGQSQVNFPRKEVSLSFDRSKVRMSQVVSLLASLGYEPELRFSDLEQPAQRGPQRKLWLQLGVAGFAFGNIMLFSISSYLGLDNVSRIQFHGLFGYLSLVLALPVFLYSASDYWRAAWVSLRQRRLNIEVPIAAGIIALFGQSVYEVVSGRGEGYFDSLAGLLFFLLCGKLFQQKTFDRLSFDRDYKSFFPLSVVRKRGNTEERVALANLAVGDCLIIRNGELVPADARLIEGPAMIDYSFVTGEAEPVEKAPGDYVYAGGRQIGGAVSLSMVKGVSQSYLTSLWNQEAFRKEKGASLDTLTNIYSQRFTKMVLLIAIGAAVFWWFKNPSLSLKSFTSVLIVACPCALALAAPFTLGAAMRVLGRHHVYLKSATVLETMARVDSVVFDKTGTLTAAGAGSISFQGTQLSPDEERWLYSMTRHSTHPYAVRIGAQIAGEHFPDSVRSFLETPGCGMEGSVAGHEIWMGSAAWLGTRNVQVQLPEGFEGSTVHVAIDGQFRGCFLLSSALRADAAEVVTSLTGDCRLALLSGDNERERSRFEALFGDRATLRFNQSPLDKLNFVREQRELGGTVMMVGDGLNDSGALRQSDVGVAVVEDVGAFSPASDVILRADMVSRIHEVRHFSRKAVRVVRLSFLVSSLYNIVGIAIAARGILSPVVCAVLMPLSSITVVAFSCGLVNWLGSRSGLDPLQTNKTP